MEREEELKDLIFIHVMIPISLISNQIREY